MLANRGGREQKAGEGGGQEATGVVNRQLLRSYALASLARTLPGAMPTPSAAASTSRLPQDSSTHSNGPSREVGGVKWEDEEPQDEVSTNCCTLGGRTGS